MAVLLTHLPRVSRYRFIHERERESKKGWGDKEGRIDQAPEQPLSLLVNAKRQERDQARRSR